MSLIPGTFEGSELAAFVQNALKTRNAGPRVNQWSDCCDGSEWIRLVYPWAVQIPKLYTLTLAGFFGSDAAMNTSMDIESTLDPDTGGCVVSTKTLGDGSELTAQLIIGPAIELVHLVSGTPIATLIMPSKAYWGDPTHSDPVGGNPYGWVSHDVYEASDYKGYLPGASGAGFDQDVTGALAVRGVCALNITMALGSGEAYTDPPIRGMDALVLTHFPDELTMTIQRINRFEHPGPVGAINTINPLFPLLGTQNPMVTPGGWGYPYGASILAETIEHGPPVDPVTLTLKRYVEISDGDISPYVWLSELTDEVRDDTGPSGRWLGFFLFGQFDAWQSGFGSYPDPTTITQSGVFVRMVAFQYCSHGPYWMLLDVLDAFSCILGPFYVGSLAKQFPSSYGVSAGTGDISTAYNDHNGAFIADRFPFTIEV